MAFSPSSSWPSQVDPDPRSKQQNAVGLGRKRDQALGLALGPWWVTGTSPPFLPLGEQSFCVERSDSPQALIPNTRGKGWGWLSFQVPAGLLQLCLRNMCLCVSIQLCELALRQEERVESFTHDLSSWRPILLDKQLFYLIRSKALGWSLEYICIF